MPSVTRLAGVAAAIAVLCGSASAEKPENPDLARGIELLRNMEDQKAVTALGKALVRPGNSQKVRAQIFVYIGIAQINQMDSDAALKSFRRAVGEDPNVNLPGQTSPKIRELFARVKREAAASRQSPASTENKNEPAVGNHDETTDAAVKPPGARGLARKPPDRSWRRNWPAWTALGLTVAAAGAAVAFGALAKKAADRASSTRIPYDEAQEHHDRARAWALGTNITSGVAGAAAIATGVLFYLGYRAGRERPAPVVLVPSRGGGMVQLRTTWSN